MAQDWYVGIGGKARRIVKAYIGVGGKAREIVAGYVGVGGKARQFWGNRPPTVKGTMANPPRGTFYSGVGLTNHAIFSQSSSGYTDAYNKSLVRSSAPDGSKDTERSGARAGNYAIFAYAATGTANGYTYAYDDNLTKVSSPRLQSNRYTDITGATAGDTAIIGYGRRSSIESTECTLFSPSLVATGITDSQSESRCDCSPLSFGQYAVFWGGVDRQSDGDVNSKSYDYSVWNSSGVVKAGRMNSYAKSGTSTAVAGGKYGIFVGGSTSGSSGRTVVETLDSNLVQTQREDSPFSVYYSAIGNCGGTVGNYAVFVVGNQDSLLYYDKNLVRTVEAFSLIKWPDSHASLGKMCIFLDGTTGIAVES